MSSEFLAKAGADFKLSERPTRVNLFENKTAAKEAIKDNAKAISELAHRLYGEADRKVLIVLQGMDTSGKDGTTKAMFHRTPPLNVNVASFKAPSKKELAHDYLWRVHNVVPGKGQITVFNRSHYEDVLVVKVKNYATPKTIEQRYAQINDFERLLVESGTTVIKFMLHISPEVQGERLRDRSYETMVQRTSTEHAPWHIIPSDSRSTRGAYRPEDFDIV